MDLYTDWPDGGATGSLHFKPLQIHNKLTTPFWLTQSTEPFVNDLGQFVIKADGMGYLNDSGMFDLRNMHRAKLTMD